MTCGFSRFCHSFPCDRIWDRCLTLERYVQLIGQVRAEDSKARAYSENTSQTNSTNWLEFKRLCTMPCLAAPHIQTMSRPTMTTVHIQLLLCGLTQRPGPYHLSTTAIKSIRDTSARGLLLVMRSSSHQDAPATLFHRLEGRLTFSLLNYSINQSINDSTS